MSENEQGAGSGEVGMERHQMLSALFASLVVSQARMALMLLGKTPHPETGQTTVDLDGAKLFIDQLEMLEEKTKGNLEQHERKLLRDHLTALQMAFVTAAGSPTSPGAGTPAQSPGKLEGAGAGPTGKGTAAEGARSAEESEARKKFSKKY